MNAGSESVPTRALPEMPPFNARASASNVWLAASCSVVRVYFKHRIVFFFREIVAPGVVITVGLGQQTLTRRGQRHARRRALEQREIELVFERLDLRGQRRLADVQLLRRAGQMARFGYGGKTSEAIEIHQRLHCSKWTLQQ